MLSTLMFFGMFMSLLLAMYSLLDLHSTFWHLKFYNPCLSELMWLLKKETFWFLQYNFEGRFDLVRFIKTVQKGGLYVHLRIGPYVCAEWNFGYLEFLLFYILVPLTSVPSIHDYIPSSSWFCFLILSVVGVVFAY